MPLLGAHMSIAGGLHRAFARIREVDGRALQIFTGNQRQWAQSPLNREAIDLFARGWKEWGDFPVAAHDSYLINLASPKGKIAARSVAAFAKELHRCELLGIPYLIMHPGAHLGDGVAAAVDRFAANLDQAMERGGEQGTVMVLLENTAGQGSALGARFEELAGMIASVKSPERLGVCLDTCHLFAAGYDIRTREAYEKTMADFDRVIGLEQLRFFHLNDSRGALGSRVDRHEHIGKGAIGIKGFELLLNDRRFTDLPMTLETPKEKDLAADLENLRILRQLSDRQAEKRETVLD